MNALVVHPGPHFSVADVYQGWVKGLRQCGVATYEYSLHDRLSFYTLAALERDGEWLTAFDFDTACHLAVKGVEAACYELEPDLVVVISGFFLSEVLCDTIRRHGTRVALIHTESPYEDDKQSERAQWVDVNVLNDPTNLERFPPRSVYLPHCHDPDVHYPRDATPGMESEFCFIGTGYQSRAEFFGQVDWTGIDAQFGGNWSHLPPGSPLHPLLVSAIDCIDNTETAQRYASTLTSANLYRREANDARLVEGWACGPREIELSAIGCWFARSPRGESDALFPMLPTFTEPAELREQIVWALDHPQERYDATVKAQAAVIDRTFDRNAAELLHLLDN